MTALAERLPNIHFENGSLLKWETVLTLFDLDAILPTNHAQIGLVGYFSERPASHFFTERLDASLENEPWDDSAPGQPITALPEYADPVRAAEHLVCAFESLPWTYELVIETSLSSDFQEILGDSFDVGGTARLFLPDDGFVSSHELPPLESIRMLTRRHVPQEWQRNRYHFATTIQGFVGRYSSRQAVQQFMGRTKALAGFLLALEICTVERSSFPQLNRRPVLRYREGNGWRRESPDWLPDEDAAVFQNVRPRDFSAWKPDEAKNLRSRLLWLPGAFAATDHRLLNAARWYFDAHSGGNELLSFVQAMVVLEILFGEKAASDVVGIGQLIANRCAFLIGTTTSERESIIRDIKRIYGTRSAIVHRGKDVLTSAEIGDFDLLKRLCRLSLRRELIVGIRGLT